VRLFARAIEKTGIPTVMLSAALDINASVNYSAPTIQRMQWTVVHASRLARPPAADLQRRYPCGRTGLDLYRQMMYI
jgi:hypothetical protein